MRCLSRDCVICDRLLIQARAELSRVDYARWQVDRLAMCDDHLRKLDETKSRFDELTRKYNEARDYHRTVRARLRREYYAFLKAAKRQPDTNVGIEAKAAALAQISVSAELEPNRAEVLAILAQCNASRNIEIQHANEYCRVHNDLREVVAQSKAVAQECMALAMKALKMQRTPLGRARFELFQKNRK